MSRLLTLSRTKEKKVGTETDHKDQRSYLPRASLTGTRSKTYGFHESKEGREFLRYLFGPFLRRTEFGVGKVASIISDSFSNRDVQTREVDRVKSALRRWHKESQSEIFPKDLDASLRLAERIECEMMAVEDIAKILSDVACTDIKIQMGLAFSRYHYGENTENYGFSIEQVVEAIEGIFAVYTAFNSSLFGNSKENDKREPEPRWQLGPTGQIYRFKPVKKHRFVLVQRFELALEEDDFANIEAAQAIRELHSGFAFPTSNQQIRMLLASHGPPFQRSYEALEMREPRN